MIKVGRIQDHIVDGKVVLPEHAAYIGRAAPRLGLPASWLANPYKVGQWTTAFSAFSDAPRQMSIEDTVVAYRYWWCRTIIPLRLMETTRLRALHDEYGKLLLLCWCENWGGEGEAPGKCHGEVVRQVLLEGEG